MLRSLARQVNPNWCAFVFNTDVKENPDLHLIFAELNDTRFVQLNDVASRKFDYWDAGYHLSDQSIAAVAEAYKKTPFRWLLVTNGDNHYSAEFLSELDPKFDAISVDFFSRWDPFALQQSQVYNRCFLNMQRAGETGKCLLFEDSLASNSTVFRLCRCRGEYLELSALVGREGDLLAIFGQAPSYVVKNASGFGQDRCTSGRSARWEVR
jgi:hypothetical protein